MFTFVTKSFSSGTGSLTSVATQEKEPSWSKEAEISIESVLGYVRFIMRVGLAAVSAAGFKLRGLASIA